MNLYRFMIMRSSVDVIDSLLLISLSIFCGCHYEYRYAETSESIATNILLRLDSIETTVSTNKLRD